MEGREPLPAETAGNRLQMILRLPDMAPPVLTRFFSGWEGCHSKPKKHHFKVENPL